VTFELVADDSEENAPVFWNELEPDFKDDEVVEGYEPVPVEDERTSFQQVDHEE